MIQERGGWRKRSPLHFRRPLRQLLNHDELAGASQLGTRPSRSRRRRAPLPGPSLGSTQKPPRQSEVTRRFPRPWPGAGGVACGGVTAALRQSANGGPLLRGHAPAAGTDGLSWETRVSGTEEADDRGDTVRCRFRKPTSTAQPSARSLTGKRRQAASPRPRREARREKRELPAAFPEVCVASLPLFALSPAPVPERGRCEERSQWWSRGTTAEAAGEGRGSGRGDPVTSGRKWRPQRIIGDGDLPGHQDQESE